jgi:hypothetical protein
MVIKIRKSTLTLIGTNMAIRSSLAVTLDDQVHHASNASPPRPSKSRVPNNSKSRLNHIKYPLDILPTNLLIVFTNITHLG